MHGFCVSRKGGTGEGGWDHSQGAVLMAAARPGCKRAWLAPGGTTLTLGCMNWLRKHYSCRARKAAWALSGCLLAENATIACSLMNIGMVRCTWLESELTENEDMVY